MIVAVDLSGTLTSGYAWKGMRDYLLSQGYVQAVRLLFFRNLPALLAFRLNWIRRVDFQERWILQWLSLFHGFHYDQFRHMAQWVVDEELWPQRRRVVVRELRQHQQQGRRVVVVSGLFEPILEALVQKLGTRYFIGTPLAFEGDILTGEVETSLVVGARKVARLQAFMEQMAVDYAMDAGHSIEAAYGDSERDIPMLEMSRHPVAVYPDARLREVAEAHGWRILTP